MNVYFISGLGADKKAFERIRLPERFSVHHLDWIPPLKHESLNDYAKRLAAPIDVSKPFSVVGLSMGGMIACAMTRFLQPHKTVLLSSIGCKGEFPPLLRFGRATRLYKLFPDFVFRPPVLMAAQRLFGTKAKDDKALIREFIRKTDPWFMKWAVDAIINWKDLDRPATVFHIHGNKDKMFPLKYTKPDVIIENGSHFMVWTKAGEVSKRLAEALG